MADKQIKVETIEGVKLKATTKSVKRYMRDGCKYSMYCDCGRCKNESWCDDNYCNNEYLFFVDNGKTTRVYCEHFEVEE